MTTNNTPGSGNPPATESWLDYTRWSGGAAIILTFGAVWRVAATGIPDREALYFILAAMAVLLGNVVKRLKFGDLELEFDRLKQEVQTKIGKIEEGEFEHLPIPTEPFEKTVQKLVGGIYSKKLAWDDDPVAQLRDTADKAVSLRAKVSPSLKYPNRYFRVDAQVEGGERIAGNDNEVAFLLHHTFPESIQYVPIDGTKASITILTVGTFTLGVALPDGTVRKLDLNNADLTALTHNQRKRFMEN